jgi:hypothetical protein
MRTRAALLALLLADCGGSPGPRARVVDAGEDYAPPDAPACIDPPDGGGQPCSDDTACTPPKVCRSVCGGGAACY